MDKGLIGFLLVFVLLIIAGVTLANSDPITPAVVEARAEVYAGPVTMSVIDQGMVFVLKWIGGATLAGLFGAAFVEGRKLYRMWMRDQRFRRVRFPQEQGPQAPMQRLPKLTREDLMLMLMSGRMPQRAYQPNIPPGKEGQDEIELDF